jgi:hypothetical protein
VCRLAAIFAANLARYWGKMPINRCYRLIFRLLLISSFMHDGGVEPMFSEERGVCYKMKW